MNYKIILSFALLLAASSGLSAQLATQKLFNYAQYSKTKPEITKNIEKGGALAYAILFKPDQLKNFNFTTDKERLESLSSLLWYLYAVAAQKDQAFASGIFVIEDPDFRLFNYLLNYVKEIYGTKDLDKEIKISTKSAYPRASTHFKDYYLARGFAKEESGIFGKSIKKDREYTHYGIDLKTPLITIPTSGTTGSGDKKTHLFFGKVDVPRNLTFIKPEEHGLQLTGALAHTWTLLKSKYTKLIGKLKTKFKDTKWIQDLLEDIPTDDESYNRKERVPSKLVADFLETVAAENSPVKKEEITKILKEIKGLGVQGLISNSQKLLDSYPQAPDAFKKQLRSFIDGLISDKNYQYPNLRIGREVIVTRQELEPSAKAYFNLYFKK